MTLTQVLAWLSGPTVGSALSYVLDQWQPWHDWKPVDKLGFDLKAVIVTVGSLALGALAYFVAVNVPQATIDRLDPYISAAFPLITFIAVQLWHSFVNKRLVTSNSLTTVVSTTSGTATGTVTTTVSGPAEALPEATATATQVAGTTDSGAGTNVAPGMGGK